MKTATDLIQALIPLSIGLACVGLLRGWIALRTKTGEPVAIRGFFRVVTWGCAILSTLGGISGLLRMSGFLDAGLSQ